VAAPEPAAPRDAGLAAGVGSVVPGKEEDALRAALGWLVGPVAARRIVERTGLVGPQRMSAPELAAAANVHPSVAERVVALRHVGQMLLPAPREALSMPERVLSALPPELFSTEHELMVVVALDGRHGLKAVVQVAQGGGSQASVSPRDVFVPLVRLGAACFVLAHNHPSGDPTPSSEDLASTRTLAEAGDLLGIPLLDHLVVVAHGYTSLFEQGWIPGPKSGPRRREGKGR
jgi:DNA repair protein RadC